MFLYKSRGCHIVVEIGQVVQGAGTHSFNPNSVEREAKERI